MLCAPIAADIAVPAACSHHHHDTFTVRALHAHGHSIDVTFGVNRFATADERRCTVTGSTFFVACCCVHSHGSLRNSKLSPNHAVQRTALAMVCSRCAMAAASAARRVALCALVSAPRDA